MISFESKGSFAKTSAFLEKMKRRDIAAQLRPYGSRGVSALRSATPRDTGETAYSWDYEIIQTRKYTGITFTNDHEVDGQQIAILIQYGHGTGTGGYVQGRDYINPAIQPIFDEILDAVWRVVTTA